MGACADPQRGGPAPVKKVVPAFASRPGIVGYFIMPEPLPAEPLVDETKELGAPVLIEEIESP
jgi:hypothetical protein